MRVNSLPKRKPTRLNEYDYSQNGYYFLTICTHNKKCILSSIVGAAVRVSSGHLCEAKAPTEAGAETFDAPKIVLSKIGKIVENLILKINQKYPCVKPDKYVIMPNHIHIILQIENGGRGNPSPTISNIIGWLKYSATKQMNQMQKSPETNIFQRSFHDHIIRNENDYLKIWNYIDSNPAKWESDCFFVE